jgi:hypothetical protein
VKSKYFLHVLQRYFPSVALFVINMLFYRLVNWFAGLALAGSWASTLNSLAL